MANEGDLSDREYEMHMKISMARRHDVRLPGPAECGQCGYPNDNQARGYALCSDCREEAMGEAG